jgi:hypothetical protein
VAGVNREMGYLDEQQVGVVSLKGSVEDSTDTLLEFDRQLCL